VSETGAHEVAAPAVAARGLSARRKSAACLAIAVGLLAVSARLPAQPPAPPPALPPPGGPVPPVSPPADTTPPVALSDLLSRAEAASPGLAAARARRRQAEFQAVAAGALPPVTSNVGHALGQGASGEDQDVIIGTHLELGGKRGRRVAAARRAVEAARAQEEQARVELSFQVRSAFVDLQAAAAEESLARENVDLARTFLRLAQAQFDAGEVPQTNVLRAQVEVENVEQALTAAVAVTTTRRAVLNTVIGAEPGSALAVPPAVLGRARPLDLPGLRELALRRSDVRAAQATLASREALVGSARVSRQPDLTAEYVHHTLYEIPGNVLRFGLAFPIFDYGAARANVRAAQATVDEQSNVVAGLRRQALQEVETAYATLQAARIQAERLGGPQLERVRRLRDLAELGYREGEFSYLELLDAQRTYLATYTQYLRAVAAANAAEAALDRATGGGVSPAPPGME
jgi:cobalt-zinc-cadmium efflux system outer membrane protein